MNEFVRLRFSDASPHGNARFFTTRPIPQLHNFAATRAHFPAGMRRVAAAQSLTKRTFDLVGSTLMLLFFLPLFLLVAIAIKLDSPGPVIFRQRRSGLHGTQFQILKFRTMRVCEDGRRISHAQRNDSRVTRVGAFLRSSSIDELPQLFNVLLGNMSLIGPRPHALAHDEHYSMLLHNYQWRFRVRPGLTGLAQVRGFRGEIHSVRCMRDRVDTDCAYVDNWSFALDMMILIKTLPLIIKDDTAY